MEFVEEVHRGGVKRAEIDVTPVAGSGETYQEEVDGGAVTEEGAQGKAGRDGDETLPKIPKKAETTPQKKTPKTASPAAMNQRKALQLKENI